MLRGAIGMMDAALGRLPGFDGRPERRHLMALYAGSLCCLPHHFWTPIWNGPLLVDRWDLRIGLSEPESHLWSCRAIGRTNDRCLAHSFLASDGCQKNCVLT